MTTRSDVRDVRNVIIAGSGPVGCTAAIDTARANLNQLVIEGATNERHLATTSTTTLTSRSTR